MMIHAFWTHESMMNCFLNLCRIPAFELHISYLKRLTSPHIDLKAQGTHIESWMAKKDQKYDSLFLLYSIIIDTSSWRTINILTKIRMFYHCYQEVPVSELSRRLDPHLSILSPQQQRGEQVFQHHHHQASSRIFTNHNTFITGSWPSLSVIESGLDVVGEVGVWEDRRRRARRRWSR